MDDTLVRNKFDKIIYCFQADSVCLSVDHSLLSLTQFLRLILVEKTSVKRESVIIA